VEVLTQLCGVGPARASLLLSVAYPDTVPFFSDELYRWTRWNSYGWSQNIKWTLKEYVSLFNVVKTLTTRLRKTAIEVEKVAYVLGRESIINGEFRSHS
jgi:hypothetical protein